MKHSAPMVDLLALSWDAARLGEAMDALARRAHLAPEPCDASEARAPANLADPDARANWVQWHAHRLGIEAEAVDAPYAEVDAFVRGVAPGLIEISADPPRALAVLQSTARRVTLLTPELAVVRVAPDALRDALCQAIEAPLAERFAQLFVRLGIAETPRARRALLAEQLGAVSVARGWLLRVSPGAPWSAQLRASRALPLGAIIFGAMLAQQALTIFAWAIIGQGALAGKFEWAWLGLWAVVLLTGVPLQMLATTASAHLGTNLGAAFKTTLLYGALKLSPEEIRHEGAGAFLGRMLDADTVEYGAFASATQMMFAAMQLVTAFGIVWLGAGGWVSAAVLALVAVATCALGFQFWRAHARYVDTYRGMTNHLVERMVGYRTRLAQQAPADWHTDEDAELARYVQSAEHHARVGNWLALLPRMWMTLGVASIAPAFIAQTAPPTSLAIALGGILLAEQALTTAINNVRGGVALGKAWQQIKPLFAAARRPTASGSWMADVGKKMASGTGAATPHLPPPAPSPLLALRDVSFRYPTRTQPALDHVSLDIFDGDRVLVQGASGGGKSTLAAVLAGLRMPETGLLLLRGYDRASVGQDAWRQRVVVAPQFHENHVFTGTFAFNLLMGRRWPPQEADGLEALAICQELGLTELLAKMPSRTQQLVGEHGWQLSHGERSRLYIARALLQRADLIILDESFAALDPPNLERALRCVHKRAPTLLVIAHP